MLINLRNALMSGRKSPLPPGARWVEYLQSTGTQYIDTGMVVAQTTKISLDISIVGNSGNFGCIDAADARCHSDSVQTEAKFRIGSSSDAYDLPVDTRVNVVADIQNLVYTANGISTPMQRPDKLPISTFGLFARNFKGTWSPCRMTSYAIQFYSNGVLIRSFAPIAIGTTGYMFDLVSGEYLPYGNKGTGDFVIGPDIPSPV